MIIEYKYKKHVKLWEGSCGNRHYDTLPSLNISSDSVSCYSSNSSEPLDRRAPHTGLEPTTHRTVLVSHPRPRSPVKPEERVFTS